jgi:hypothetical protein
VFRIVIDIYLKPNLLSFIFYINISKQFKNIKEIITKLQFNCSSKQAFCFETLFAKNFEFFLN